MALDTFATERLTAERLTEGHYDVLRSMDQDPMLMAMLGGVRDEGGTRGYLDTNLRHWDEYGFGVWMLRETGTREIVGRGVLRHLAIDRPDDVEVGYGFVPAQWGRGLATEIAKELVRRAHEDLGLRTLVALTLPSNEKSQRVLTKVGMHLQAEVQHAGVPHRFYRMALPAQTPTPS